MAHYSVHVGGVKRSLGQNAIASAAYNSRSKLVLNVTDKETNVTVQLAWNYRDKPGLAYSKIYTPENAPEWVHDREVLWNKAEHAENRCDAITAGKIMIALPNEFSISQNIELIDEIATELSKLGMIVDCNMHNDKEHNPHLHIMHTTRELVENRYGEIEFSPIKNRTWQGRDWVKFCREFAEEKINKHYGLNGFDIRISHKSYKDQGIDIKPSVHEGPARNIKNSELVELNRQIAEENASKIREKPSVILDAIGMNNPVFTKEQIAAELDKRIHAGIDFSKIENVESLQQEFSGIFTNLYEQIVNSSELSLVIEGDLKGRDLYTTSKRLELEERFIDNVKHLQNAKTHCLNSQDSDLDQLSLREEMGEKISSLVSKKTSKISLSKEQRKAIVNILNGPNISILEGLPGAGKTKVMQEVVRQYKKNSFRVLGVAPSSSASLVLQEATGVKCMNASLWRKQWLKERQQGFELMLRADYYKEDSYIKGNDKEKSDFNKFSQKIGLAPSLSLTNKDVILVDEASMMELANMDYFASEARASGAKIILILDNNQLAPVGHAGASVKAVDICGSEKLTEARRQQNPEHIRATKYLSQYRVRDALDIYWKAGAITLVENEAAANSVTARKFVNKYIKIAEAIERDDLVSNRSIAIGVFGNKTREILNTQVREQLKEAGILKGKEYRILVGSRSRPGDKVGAREKYYLNLSRGDQIVFSRNEKQVGWNGVLNGQVGTVLKVRKPDEQGLARIDILVHKPSANGSKCEKVTLDLKDLATGKITSKYFHDGISIDYGYAVTAHKLQGASITEMIPRIEKGVGFEVMNVLLTRHEKEIEMVVSKELLKDAYYESLDKTAASAKNRFELKVTNEGRLNSEEILKEGLVKIASKRTNTSLATSYKTMGQVPEDQIIKDYIDKSEETISVMRKLTSWQSQSLRKNGYKPALWEHEVFWKEFTESRDKRNQVADRLCDDEYIKFKERLLQLNMNYATIEKHANQYKRQQGLLGKEGLLPELIVDQKITDLHNQNNYKALMLAVAAGQSIAVRNNYKEVNLAIADSLCTIEENNVAIKELEEHRQEFVDAIATEEHYRNVLTPEYLNRIYHTYPGTRQDAGSEALVIYQEMVEEHGVERATKMVEKNPELLGAYKGYGFGKLWGLNNNRKDAIALCQNLGKQLKGFVMSEEITVKYKEEMHQADFAGKINSLEKEIEYLRTLLPSDIDQEFLDMVGEKLNKASSRDNSLDWRDVQDSALFEAIRVSQYTDQKEISEISTNSTKSKKLVSKQNKIKEQKRAAQTPKSSSIVTTNQKTKENSKPQLAPQLTFEEVRNNITQSVVLDIFHKYAPMMNSEDKIVKKANGISVGSLHMSLGGNKAGLWKRFSGGGSGDIFTFVEHAAGCSKYEALEIVAAHAGVVAIDKSSDLVKSNINNRPAPVENNQDKNQYKEVNRNSWIAYDIVPESANKFDYKKDLAFIAKNGAKITHTHEYRNVKGQLLGYVVRIEQLESARKQVLPVSYCYIQKNNKISKIDPDLNPKNSVEPKWRLQGFSDNGNKPIYGVEKLSQYPNRAVLVVEGEKTADAAQKMFPDHIVISWMGGAQSVNRVDWQKLSGRVVTIWPDNDKPGIEAAENIKNHIDCVNGFTGVAQIIDTKALNLPEKWDLADEVPQDSKIDNKNLIASFSEIISTSRDNANVANKTKMSQIENTGQDKIIPDSIDMLVAKGQLCQDEYLSKALYHETISRIAKLKDINLDKIQNGEEFVNTIRGVQHEYQSLNQAYQKREQEKGYKNPGRNDAKEKFVHDMVRELVILHQLQSSSATNHNQPQELQLTKSHLEHIEETIKKEIDKLSTISTQNFSDKDKSHLANNIYKVVSSDKWQQELNAKNQLKSQLLMDKNKKVAQEIKQVHITLSGFKEEKQHAKTNEELFVVIKKESEYLSSLDGNLKYPKDHDKQLLARISRVGKTSLNQETKQVKNILPISGLDHLHNNLQSVSNYAVKKNILSHEQLTGHLKSDHDIIQMHKNISQDCFKHHCDIISEHHKQIISGKTIKHDGHKFDCPIKYLEHWKSSTKHHLLPMKDINNKLDHHLKQQKDMGLDHNSANSRGHGVDLDM